jgi:hypothetical protein
MPRHRLRLDEVLPLGEHALARVPHDISRRDPGHVNPHRITDHRGPNRADRYPLGAYRRPRRYATSRPNAGTDRGR